MYIHSTATPEQQMCTIPKDASTRERDDKIRWLSAVLSRPTWRSAFAEAQRKTRRSSGFNAAAELQRAGTITIGDRAKILMGFSNRVRADDPVLSLAWQLLALRPSDDEVVVRAVVDGAFGLLRSCTDGSTRTAIARLRVWRDVAIGKYDGTAYSDDFFDIAKRYWPAEMDNLKGDRMRPATAAERHPAFDLLMCGRWDDAFGTLHARSEKVIGAERAQALLDALSDRKAMREEIRDLVDLLYACASPNDGATALAWSMLNCDPRKPETFHAVMPQLQHALDAADLPADDDAGLRRRLRVWWRAAEGEFKTAKVSIFRFADPEAECWPDPAEPNAALAFVRSTPAATASGPTLVVMPKVKATKLNSFHSPYKDLVDAPLPLVIVRDLARSRAALHAEFPHATVAVDLLLRDLREGKTARVAPVCLVGDPGSGKSRMVRKVSDLLRTYLYRFDAGSSTDAHFAGTSKAWGNTEPSVPMRAIAQSQTASPWILLDEIDKAGTSNHNGSLTHALLGFLDVETACRYRDQSLDAEVDLSACSFASTANSVEKMPSPLRDRFRIIRVPNPTLAHLPPLAANVMRDLAAQDEARAGDEPLARDELANIGRAWAPYKFSMRALKSIVRGTLEARDSCAMRH